MDNIQFNNQSNEEVQRDYANIMLAKSGKNEGQKNLWLKYMPLIKRYAQRYSHLDSYEDRIQESYFILLKTLDYCDVNKMDSKFNFGFFYKMKLAVYFRTEAYESYQKMIEKDMMSCNMQVEWEGELCELQDILEDEKNCFSDRIEFELVYDEFKKTLNNREKKILALLEIKGEKKEIAKKMKMSQPNMSYYTNKIKNNFVYYMNQNGYDIAIA